MVPKMGESAEKKIFLWVENNKVFSLFIYDYTADYINWVKQLLKVNVTIDVKFQIDIINT